MGRWVGFGARSHRGPKQAHGGCSSPPARFGPPGYMNHDAWRSLALATRRVTRWDPWPSAGRLPSPIPVNRIRRAQSADAGRPGPMTAHDAHSAIARRDLRSRTGAAGASPGRPSRRLVVSLAAAPLYRLRTHVAPQHSSPTTSFQAPTTVIPASLLDAQRRRQRDAPSRPSILRPSVPLTLCGVARGSFTAPDPSRPCR